MITNKDIRVENGFLIINGDPYPLDGQSPEAIMQIVKDNSDSTPTENSTAPITSGGVFAADKAISDTIGDITQTGVTGASVAEQISEINGNLTKQAVTVTKTSAVTSNSGIIAYICNNFCFVTIDANIQSGAVDGTVLATGFTKPINFGAIGRTSEAFDIMINSSGELIIKGTPTTGWVQGSISYMI